MLAQIDHDPTPDAGAISARHQLDPHAVEALIGALTRKGLVVSDASGERRSLTPAGRLTLERLVDTGRRRLDELLVRWEPGEHRELTDLVARLAHELPIDTGQLDRLMRRGRRRGRRVIG